MSKGKNTFFAVIIAVAAFGLIACGGGGGGGGGTTTTSLKGLAACQPVTGEGVICGTFLAPDGQTPIAGAEVALVNTTTTSLSLKGMYADEAGKLIAGDKCITDDAGGFACGGITSAGVLNYQISGGGFTKAFSASTTLGEVTNVPTSDTTATAGSGTKKYAVILGAFDSIEDILARVLGCGTLVDGALQVGTECPNIELIDAFGTNPNTALTNALGLAGGVYPTLTDFLKSANTPAALALFDGIFFNCGCSEALTNDPEVQGVLQTYVNNGGNVYASDWAYLYVENTWPHGIEWYGDDLMDEARVGDINPAQPVNVVNSGLLTWLRAEGLIGPSDTTFNVNFNLGVWVVMTDVGTGTSEILNADSLPNGPSDVPVAPRTTLPITADFSEGSGCVFYTSYHNEPASEVSTTEVQSRVLEYLLLNTFGNCS